MLISCATTDVDVSSTVAAIANIARWRMAVGPMAGGKSWQGFGNLPEPWYDWPVPSLRYRLRMPRVLDRPCDNTLGQWASEAVLPVKNLNQKP
jgi:hypothetical protein